MQAALIIRQARENQITTVASHIRHNIAISAGMDNGEHISDADKEIVMPPENA